MKTTEEIIEDFKRDIIKQLIEEKSGQESKFKTTDLCLGEDDDCEEVSAKEKILKELKREKIILSYKISSQKINSELPEFSSLQKELYPEEIDEVKREHLELLGLEPETIIIAKVTYNPSEIRARFTKSSTLELKAVTANQISEPVRRSEKPFFNEETSKIIWDNKECSVPLKTNQFFFCKKMFSVPFGTRIKEQDVMDLIDWDKDTKRSVYDAMRAVNKRIKEKLGIKKFFEWRNNHIWIDEKIFDL